MFSGVFYEKYQLCNYLKPSESENVGDVWNKPKSLDDTGPPPVMMIDHLEPMTGAPWSKPAHLDMNSPQMMTEQMVGVSNEPNQLEPMVGGSWSKSTHLQHPNEPLLGAPWSIDAIASGISKIVSPFSPSVSTFYCPNYVH